MKEFIYRGRGGEPPKAPKRLPPWEYAETIRPDHYLASPELIDAVNVAILLSQPLLLTGEPGTGKTQLAYSVAWDLGYGDALRYQVKSTSKARDLFYTYDAIGRFQAIQTRDASKLAGDFITYQALGKALLFANDPETVRHLLPADLEHPGRRSSVVLIDEIDKAPRDFPNDILGELEKLAFDIRELNSPMIVADRDFRPVVVITSNSEKQLPDAFLRRCVYYHIPFPDHRQLEEIVTLRLGASATLKSEFVRDAIYLLEELRSDGGGLRKKPATAELLGWIAALRRYAPNVENPIVERTDAIWRTLSVLVKTKEDQDRARSLIEIWLQEHPQ